MKMDDPKRIQLSRAKGWTMPPNTLKVDRTTIWGNNFRLEDFDSAEECVDMFAHDLDKFACFHPEKFETYITPLIGKNLACWCKLGSPCHAEVLMDQAREFGAYLCLDAAGTA
jgi:hypothetical protein